MMKMIRCGESFGLIQCDTHILDHVSDIFSEKAPYFKDTKISRANLRGHVESFAVDNGHPQQSAWTLIGSLHGSKIVRSVVFPPPIGCHHDL